MEEMIVKGYWWIPSKPEESIAGVLTYNGKIGVLLNCSAVLHHSTLSIIENLILMLANLFLALPREEKNILY